MECLKQTQKLGMNLCRGGGQGGRGRGGNDGMRKRKKAWEEKKEWGEKERMHCGSGQPNVTASNNSLSQELECE